MKKTADQRHGPVRVYSAEEIAEYSRTDQAAETAALAAQASADYGEARPHRVLMTAADRSQRNITVMATSVEHAEDIARERYPHMAGFDAWQQVRSDKSDPRTKEVQS